MTFSPARLRADFPALDSGTAFFDAPGGTQTPRQVSEAIASSMRAPLSNRGRGDRAQRNAEDIVVGARRALADFTGAPAAGVVIGRSATQLTFDFARAWRSGGVQATRWWSPASTTTPTSGPG